ncbi:MAG: alpha/beta hydrolase-fold protein [Prolixibacteraceae bacterium]|nr:alpha/beta hydrolase-fold protein [Prolixibacteraceae bacterium]
MKKLLFSFLSLIFFTVSPVFSQTGSLSVKTWIDKEITEDTRPEGRIFLFVSKSKNSQPRLNTWPNRNNIIYATNLENFQKGDEFIFDNSKNLSGIFDFNPGEIPNGSYMVQVLWDHDNKESDINAPGNLYSESVLINLNSDSICLELPLTQTIETVRLAEHPLLKEVEIQSKVLSKWRKKEIRLKAAVLLPSGYYDEPDRKYPVRYNIAGFGGRYTRANKFVTWDKKFLKWWLSDDAPQIINVFLDSEGPFGDCYQLDSKNNGPYGTALINEFIPYIENKFRATGNPENRFLDGCSTGGWVSLALQIFYPDQFGGCFSYSPDPVDFENFQLINIYRDENAFFNEYGYLRPLSRNITGEPVVSQKDFILYENVLGRSNSYVTSGGQFGSFNALFSPKGRDGLPKPLFDPLSGKIDKEVAEHWRKYDLKYYLENNWAKVGPKIHGKIWIWMGDMDEFYLNTALRAFEEMLQVQDNPESDASINFSPMSGHCARYSHEKVLLQIAEKLENQIHDVD